MSLELGPGLRCALTTSVLFYYRGNDYTRYFQSGHPVRIFRTTKIGSYLVESLDAKWEGECAPTSLAALSPLEQLADAADD